MPLNLRQKPDDHKPFHENLGLTQQEYDETPSHVLDWMRQHRQKVGFGVYTTNSDVGTVYFVDKTTHVGITEILGMPEDELKELFYPRELVEHIKSQLK